MKKVVLVFCFLTSLISCVEQEFYKTGELQSIVKKSFFRNEITRTEYYNSGSIKKTETWRYGVKSGIHSLFYENGGIHKKIPFKNGKANGIVETYYENGELESTTTYASDIRKGDFKAYFPNGNLNVIGEIFEDSIHLWRKEFYENGQLMAYNYINDSINYFKFFSEDGDLITVQYPLDILYSESEICIELQHSQIPEDSLTVAFYFGTESEILSGSPDRKKAIIARGSKVCIPKETLEMNDGNGFFCELIEGKGIESFNEVKIFE